MERSKVRWVSATAAAAVALVLAIGPNVRAQVSSQGLIQAPGAPVVDCTGASLARLESGMGTQREALRRAEEMYRQAQEGHLKASDPNRERSLLLSAVKTWAEKQITMLKALRAMKLEGLTVAQRRTFTTLVNGLNEAVERVQAVIAAGPAGFELGKAITANADLLESALKFMDDSGLGDQVARVLASGLGTPGQLAVEGLILARDYVLGAAGEVISAEELTMMRDNLDNLRRVVSNNEARIRDLRDMMTEGCKPARTQTQESPRPIPPQDPPAPTPAPAPAPAPAAKKGGGGKLLGLALGLGAVGVGGYYISQALTTLEDPGGDGGSGGQPRLVGSPRFVCSGATCSGDIVVNFPFAIQSGFVTAATSPASFVGQSPKSGSGDVTIRMSRPNNQCYGTQTNLTLWDSAFQQGPQWNLSVSIPVTCG